jgi:Holliday junction resolvasome RuvABC DNA-binding subunit
MVLLRQRQLQERARTEQERAKTDQARADAEHSRRMRDAEYVRALIEALREMHEALVQMGFSEDEARREVGNVIRALAPVTGLAEAKKILPARTPAA